MGLICYIIDLCLIWWLKLRGIIISCYKINWVYCFNRLWFNCLILHGSVKSYYWLLSDCGLAIICGLVSLYSHVVGDIKCFILIRYCCFMKICTTLNLFCHLLHEVRICWLVNLNWLFNWLPRTSIIKLIGGAI